MPKELTEKQIKFAERSKARQSALSSGEVRYVSNSVCPNGHVGERYTKDGRCCECTKQQSSSESKKEYDRKRYQEKKEEIKKSARERHAENPDYGRENAKRWAAKNKGKVSAIKKNYKAKRRAKESSGVSGAELNKWISEQKKVCYWCEKACSENYHIDHYQPLSKGGKHELYNLVVACETCNVRKNAKDPYQFAQEVGRLL